MVQCAAAPLSQQALRAQDIVSPTSQCVTWLQVLFARIEQLSHKVDEQRQGSHLPGRCSEKVVSEELERCRPAFALIALCKAMSRV